MAEPVDHTLPALRARYGERYRWLLLLSVMVGTMAAIMSSTIINVAIPDMSQHFTLGQERAQWATSGFMAAMTVSMLTTPWLLARYGYRSTYVGCMVLLLVGGVQYLAMRSRKIRIFGGVNIQSDAGWNDLKASVRALAHTLMLHN